MNSKCGFTFSFVYTTPVGSQFSFVFFRCIILRPRCAEIKRRDASTLEDKNSPSVIKQVFIPSLKYQIRRQC
ncbi:hypothetical protein CEXT_308191 [Caerostris extrusa]|uniref:Uncharacterized protein n=1 Tax=Caerostris extrusa TaxID=172846 RepID=A0AAV4PB13_CAEEX|nr:hypothetical protein CEXT_308191 [Caerostris extrusa]